MHKAVFVKIAVISLLILLAGSTLHAQLVSAQVSGAPAEQVRKYNNQLLQVYGHLALLSPGQAGTAAELRSAAGQVIQQRSLALKSLIQQNPMEALSLAFDAAT